MNRNATHRITVCTSCSHKGRACQPGYELIAKLRAAISAAGDVIGEEFEISGTACMTGCDRPCTVAYHSTRKASYLFGDVDPDDDVANLVDFARQYETLHDGWSSAVGHPDTLHSTTLARIPATIMAVEETTELVS